MKNTEQILQLIIKNVYINLEKGDYKSLNENIIMYQETITSNSKHIDSIHHKYFTELNKTLSESVIVNQLKMGQNENVRLLLNSVNNIESLLNIYKGNLTYNDEVKEVIHNSKAKEMLKYSIENNILVMVNGDVHRRIGKTTELLKMANNLCCSLVVSNSTSEDYCYQLIENKIKEDCDIIKGSSVLNVGGFTCRNKMFLVDEFVPKEVIDELIKKGNKLLGGFINYNKF